ncbi:DurN family substrate-assisted peptide maturase [Scytonema sp. PCC 10023]|uniref:DurN family substrate-assisted peptide maturase n=1 Tax=Scytonema sp. PCC 10023 TaxID=1680591 RepID=UPI0039C6E2EC
MTQSVSTTDEIRQIQMIMILLLLASPKGALASLFRTANAVSDSQVDAKMTPCTDDSFNGLKSWLELLLAQGGLTTEEQSLVNWQNNPANMIAAIEELKAIQNKINLKLSIQKKS